MSVFRTVCFPILLNGQMAAVPLLLSVLFPFREGTTSGRSATGSIKQSRINASCEWTQALRLFAFIRGYSRLKKRCASVEPLRGASRSAKSSTKESSHFFDETINYE